ncbi:MAG: acylneuraminate cytidylyltransferase family protein [Alphaproteobacteria bacterium]|nr:acylneuraminate cytidylyltransferase family protein [Alphaproteobacteria bacterium]MBT5859764.1 acylneuraminate cytidylyltransferase family protein [Alphaproteobacteria bacterium]
MISGKTVLGVIPARGGSKGLPGKNIAPLLDKPLIAWAIESGQNSKLIDRLVFSSENSDFNKIAADWGCEVPFSRPENLASDHANLPEVVLNILDTLKDHYDYVVLLQPTSPLRTAHDIDGAITKCLDAKAPSCMSITLAERSPYKMYRMAKGDRLESILEPPPTMRRQDLPEVFSANGAVYVAQCDWLRKSGHFETPETVGYPMPADRSIDIDSELDLQIAASILDRRTSLPSEGPSSA